MVREPIRARDALAALAIAIATGVAAASPPLDLLRGLSIDALTALHWRVAGDRRGPAASPTVVIAFDEETYRTPPFKGSPTVLWTREIGRVLTAVLEADARVIGFDSVFPVSIEESEIPLGDETLGSRLRGFDRDFLRALALAARSGKLVLGEIQLGDQLILPAPGQRVAIGHGRNIRALNLYSDADNVVRRVPLTFMLDGEPVPSMSVELAARALGAEPVLGAQGRLTLAGYPIPQVIANTLTLNFVGGSGDIPTYSLADLRACAEKGDTEFFRRNFAGKVVLVGTRLDAEDRQTTSKRFATAAQVAAAERCALPAPPPARFVSHSIDGVYVHATAVNNLLRHDALTELGRLDCGLIAVASAALAAFAALELGPALAALSFMVLALIWTAGTVAAFGHALAFPLFEPLFAGLLALAVTIGFRLVVTDKAKRLLRRSFSLYLAPAVVEKMVASSKPPALGGEMRSVTVFFSDIAGFSSFAEAMPPPDLVALMNAYLSAMTDIIEEHGGFVDKYIGDAIVAVFGAPLDDIDHAGRAVRAALRCCDRLRELNRNAAPFKVHPLGHRIGLNSGAALVGNIGSRRRFNYTVVGDSVNLASRLEGANKYFGTSILASEATVALTGKAFEWREIDAIRVWGRLQPVGIYEPLAPAGLETREQAARAQSYAEGLACWRARDFAGAAARFAGAADGDPPSALFLQRAERLLHEPPAADWEPITALEGK